MSPFLSYYKNPTPKLLEENNQFVFMQVLTYGTPKWQVLSIHLWCEPSVTMASKSMGSKMQA